MSSQERGMFDNEEERNKWFDNEEEKEGLLNSFKSFFA
jgi:hypothetical protein